MVLHKSSSLWNGFNFKIKSISNVQTWPKLHSNPVKFNQNNKCWHFSLNFLSFLHYLKKHGSHFLWTFSRLLTWCKAVSPSMLAVSISAPRFNSLSTSSLSEAAHAAKKTQPSVNWILWDFRLGSEGSWFVSLSCHLFNCSALLNKAEELRFSREVMISVKVGLTELHSYYSLG